MRGPTVFVIFKLLLALACARAPWATAQDLSDAEKRQRIAAMYQEYKADHFAGLPDLTVEELEALRAAGEVVLVDVRSAAERAVSTIPGAISKAAFEARPELHRGRRVVTYCTIGLRSGRYARQLRERGVEAYNLAGSVLAWSHAGEAFVDEEGPTRRVHVYGTTWDLAADGYEAVW